MQLFLLHTEKNQRLRRSRGGTGGTLLWLVLFLIPLIPVAVFFIFPHWVNQNVPFFEQEPPEIALITAPRAVGTEVVTFSAKITDSRRGVDEVILRVTQNNKTTEIARTKTPPGTTPSIDFHADFQPKELGLREGIATLSLIAFDRSFWSNRAEVSTNVRVLYSRPRVEVLTAQHNVAQGGASIAFYRLLAGEIAESGVLVGSRLFRGFPAAVLDTELGRDTRLYFSLFAVPKYFNPAVEKVSVIARDIAGNTASTQMNYLILRRKFRDAPIALSETFLRSKVPDLLPEFAKLSGDTSIKIDGTSSRLAELSGDFKNINETFRSLLDNKIQTLLSQSEQKKYWDGVFSRPMLGSPTSAFGEERRYSLNDEEVSRSAHDGIDLAAVANTVVRAAMHGKVVYANDLGIYGNAVIIDHGCGLSSLYGHLSSIGVNVGQEVNTNDALGRSGATGLAGGDHLHFEIRVQGLPVTPIEWWDPSWIRDHIEERIKSMRESLAIESRQR